MTVIQTSSIYRGLILDGLPPSAGLTLSCVASCWTRCNSVFTPSSPLWWWHKGGLLVPLPQQGSVGGRHVNLSNSSTRQDSTTTSARSWLDTKQSRFRETERQTDRETKTDRQTDRQTDTQTERQRQTHTEAESDTHRDRELHACVRACVRVIYKIFWYKT